MSTEVWVNGELVMKTAEAVSASEDGLTSGKQVAAFVANEKQKPVVVENGKTINFSRAAAGEKKPLLSMSLTSAANSPAFDPEWLKNDYGLVNIGMIKALIAAGGIGGQWDGGIVANAVIFEKSMECRGVASLLKDVFIGSSGSAAWVKMANTNAGYTWGNVPVDALPTKGQIDQRKLDKPTAGNIGNVLTLGRDGPMWGAAPAGGGGASAGEVLENVQSFYDVKARPYDYTAGPHLPIGWYRIEVLMIATSPPGIILSKVLNASRVADGRICSVMGLAYPGSISDNSGTPYISYDGLDWLTQTGGVVGSSGKRASSLQLSFLYKHDLGISYEPDWMESARMGPNSDISSMSVRYTRIGLAPEESRWFTTKVPTEGPTSPPTEVTTELPTEGPTEQPTDTPTEPPTDVPSDVPTDVPTEPPVEAPAFFRVISGDNVRIADSGAAHDGSGAVVVESNMDEWGVTYGDSWVKVSPASGNIPKSGPICYWQIDAWAGPGRETTVTFWGKRRSTGQTLTHKVVVSQDATTTLARMEAPDAVV